MVVQKEETLGWVEGIMGTVARKVNDPAVGELLQNPSLGRSGLRLMGSHTTC